MLTCDEGSNSPDPLSYPWCAVWRAVSKRPKLLFLACFFPPVRAIGSVRTWNMAKYLARLGWDVTVVTPRPSLWRYTDDPDTIDSALQQEGIRRILTEHRWRCLQPDNLYCWNSGLGWFLGGVCRRIARYWSIDSGIGWINAAEQACSHLTPTDVDVILASGSPFASFTLARRVSARLGRPYVLDYRDPWTMNPAVTRPPRPRIVRQEARLLADCAAVTIVSPAWAAALEQRFGLGSKVHVLTNGYDPEELSAVIPHDFGHPAFVYAGNFYPPQRIIAPVMAALCRLRAAMNGSEWYFHYYGPHEEHVRQAAGEYRVMDRVVIHGNVPRREVLAAIRGAKAAVVIMSTGEEVMQKNRGWIPAKVFEIMGLQTPMLLVAPPGSDIEGIIDRTGLGQRFSGNDIAGMARFFANALRGLLPPPTNDEAYAWPTLATKLDAILRGALPTPA